MRFPNITARSLEGREVRLPEGFGGERNMAVVAFQRQQQELVDSWVPWLEERAAADQGFCFYELPTIGRIWIPVRRFIDGGMASAIRDPVIFRRTLTVYGDVGRVTGPLGIEDRSTIALLLVDGTGVVRWSGSGGFIFVSARDLDDALGAR